MKLVNLQLINYKSIKKTEIGFSNKSIILGANASGKSNLISSMKFVNYILMYGIDDAVSLMGGFDNLINLKTKQDESLSISFTLELENCNWYRTLNKDFNISPNKVFYQFKLLRNSNSYKISYDELTISFGMYKKNNKHHQKELNEKFDDYIVKFSKSNKKSATAEILNDKTKEPLVKTFLGFFLNIINDDKKELILKNIKYIMPPTYFDNNEVFKIYDFDPKLLKLSSSITSKKSLEEDGSNIGLFLERLLKDRKNKEKLLRLLNICLPNTKTISIKNNIDKSISYQLKEIFYDKPLYSQFLSDGTVSMIALILALYFCDNENIIILEEPERNLHPQIIAKLIMMINEVSQDKQIIITTHNVEIVKKSQLEELICLKRDSDGYTIISKPKDNQVVKTFIKNEIGLDELFLTDLF